MKIRISFNDLTMIATLYDNPSARDLASMLPLDLQIDDFGNNEKIAYLPRKLTEEGSGPLHRRAAGRPLLLRALGKSCLLLRRLSSSRGLIRLGRFDGGFEALRVRGDFPLRIDPVS